MKNKVALVTGAARGIGFAIAEAMAAAGARVALADMDGDAVAAAAAQLQQAGHQALAITAHVGVREQVEAMVAQAAAYFGGIDILVNNAGGSAGAPLLFDEVTEEDFDRVWNWNMKSVFLCTKAVLPHLRARGGGAIISLGSIAGRGGVDEVSPQYSAAKAAVHGFTRNLARQLGPEGIRVNAIAPGFIASGQRIAALWEKKDQQKVLNSIPLRRRGENADIAAAAVFLASDNSSYITGAILDVNGGFLCV